MAGDLQPLDQKFAIVDEHGQPTPYFIKWAQQRQIDIGTSLTLQDLLDYLAEHILQEGLGIALTPSGDLNDSPSIAVRNGIGLNFDAMDNLKLADTAVAPGIYGDATHVAQITVDQQGRITNVAPIAITGGGGSGTLITLPAITSGRFYPPDTLDMGIGTGAVASGLLSLFPFSKKVTLDALTLEVTTAGAAGSTARVGLYTADGTTGLPKALIEEPALVSIASVGTKVFPLSATYSVAGPIWICCEFSAGCTLRIGATNQRCSQIFGGAALSSAANFSRLQVTRAYGPLPADGTTLVVSPSNATQMLAARAA